MDSFCKFPQTTSSSSSSVRGVTPVSKKRRARCARAGARKPARLRARAFLRLLAGESACALRRNAHGMGRSAVIKMLRTNRRSVRRARRAPFLSPTNKFNRQAARSSSFYGRFRWKSSTTGPRLKRNKTERKPEKEREKEERAGRRGERKKERKREKKKELQLVTGERALVATAILISPLHSIAPLACCLKARLVHVRRCRVRTLRTDFSRRNREIREFVTNAACPNSSVFVLDYLYLVGRCY